MFSRSDLARVLAPDVNRGNWRQNQEVLQLIASYAKEVAICFKKILDCYQNINNLTDIEFNNLQTLLN